MRWDGEGNVSDGPLNRQRLCRGSWRVDFPTAFHAVLAVMEGEDLQADARRDGLQEIECTGGADEPLR